MICPPWLLFVGVLTVHGTGMLALEREREANVQRKLSPCYLQATCFAVGEGGCPP